MARLAQLVRSVQQVVLHYTSNPHFPSHHIHQITFNPRIGAIGPTGAPGIAYAYLSCFYQSGSPTVTSGRVLATYIASFTANANLQCSVVCNAQVYNFFGTVNSNATSVDCYCGNTLNYVTIVSLGSGIAPDNNCASCSGGPAPPGECGVITSSTVAIYSRAF